MRGRSTARAGGRASISPVAPWHGPLRVYAAACQPPRLARDERRGDGFSPPAQQGVAREPALSLAGGAGPKPAGGWFRA